ncbi:MAG: ABC transporter permease, partial [Cyanobacteria bacterium J06633_23]
MVETPTRLASPTPVKESVPSSLRPTVFWRIAEDIPPQLSRTLMVLSVVVPLVLWWGLSHLPGVNTTFLPSPEAVIAALGRLWEKGFLVKDTQMSILRVSIGFALSIIV